MILRRYDDTGISTATAAVVMLIPPAAIKFSFAAKSAATTIISSATNTVFNFLFKQGHNANTTNHIFKVWRDSLFAATYI